MTKVCFCGISGNGMSPLAQILALKGYEVYGSDRSFDNGLDVENRSALESMGIKIIPQDGSCITPDMTIYVSAALDKSNPDIQSALKLGLSIKQRSDLLAEIFSQYPYGIAVGGTSGKTTTTAMIGYILDMLEQHPCMINGGMLRNYQHLKSLPNFIYNQDDICVIEADESDGSICKYYPRIGLINNISHDHTSMEKLIEYFNTFAEHCSDAIVVNYDCKLTRNMQHHKKVISFSTINPEADFYAENIKFVKDGIKYDFQGHTFSLKLYGTFNVSNALAAIAVCSQVGIRPLDAAATLEGFTGIKRRLEIVDITKNDITVIDDFAHNPSKINSSLQALKDYDGRLIVMYQSHSAFSAQNTGSEVAEVIANVLDKNDIFLMPEVYMLDKNKDVGITAENIIKQINALGFGNAFFFDDRKKIHDYIIKNAKPHDRIVIMGARDNTLPLFSRSLLKEL